MSVPEVHSPLTWDPETPGVELYLTKEMKGVLEELKNEWISYEIVSESDWYTLVGEKWNKEQLTAFMNAWDFPGICTINSGAFIWNIIFDTHNGIQIPSEDMIQRSNTLDLWGTTTLVNVSRITWNSEDIREFCAYLPEQRKYSLTYKFPIENQETPTKITVAWNYTRADVRETLSPWEKIPQQSWDIVRRFARGVWTILQIWTILQKWWNVVQGAFWNQEKNITAEAYEAWMQRLEKLLELLPQNTSLFSSSSLMNARWKWAIKWILEEYFRNDVHWNNYTAKIWEPDIEKAEQIESLRNIIEFIQETARRLKDIQNIDITNTSLCKAIREALKIPYMTRVDWFNEWLDKVAKRFPFPKNTYAPDIRDVLGNPQGSVSLAAE